MFFRHRSKLKMAQDALESNNYAQAETLFSEILEASPEAVEAILHRALIRLRLQKHEEALADAEKVISLRAENSLGLMIKGEILLELERFSEAYEALYKACEIEKDNGRAFYGLSRACIGLGKKHEAADYMEVALQFERDYTLSKCFVEILSQSK